MKKRMNLTMPKITSSPQQLAEESSNGLYTKAAAAYGSVKNLQKASKLPEKTVQKVLHTQNAYTK